MAMTDAEIKAWLIDYVSTNPGWNWSQWNDETYYLGLHHKFDQQLIDLKAMYEDKLKRIYQFYKEMRDILRFGVSESFIQATSEDAIFSLKEIKDKVMRIARKLRGVNAEIQGRGAGFFGPGLTYDRVYHGTDYFIDLDAGNDGNTGLSIAQAWLTLGQYTTVTARSAGDRAFVRANTSETVGASIACDEDGAADNPIYIIGCDSVTNDPWGDASDVKPITDHNVGAYTFGVDTDDFWQIERMVFKNSTSSSGNFVYDRNMGLIVKSCEFLDATTYGVRGSSRGTAYFEGCTFSNNDSAAFYSLTTTVRFNNCIFDAGAGGSGFGLYGEYGGHIECIDCSFGQSNAFNTNGIFLAYSGIVYLRNCLHNDDFNAGRHTVIFEEDTNGVKGANRTICGAGTITKDTGVTRVGGADSSAKMEPTAIAGGIFPLTLNNNSLVGEPFKIWCAAALTTITIYIRSLGTWGTYPTADELYIEASYLDEAATSAHRAKVQSNDVLSHASDWKAFDVTFTPLQAGFVYLNVFLKKYEDAGDGCYVDIKHVIS